MRSVSWLPSCNTMMTGPAQLASEAHRRPRAGSQLLDFLSRRGDESAYLHGDGLKACGKCIAIEVGRLDHQARNERSATRTIRVRKTRSQNDVVTPKLHSSSR